MKRRPYSAESSFLEIFRLVAHFQALNCTLNLLALISSFRDSVELKKEPLCVIGYFLRGAEIIEYLSSEGARCLTLCGLFSFRINSLRSSVDDNRICLIFPPFFPFFLFHLLTGLVQFEFIITFSLTLGNPCCNKRGSKKAKMVFDQRNSQKMEKRP